MAGEKEGHGSPRSTLKSSWPSREQIVPVDKLIEDAKELVTVPLLEPGERFLVGNEDTPPPDQLEMHLP